MILWETCGEYFKWDGSLRDIYITPATIAEWQIVYLLLRNYPLAEYSVDGTVHTPPLTVEEIFLVRRSGAPMLRIKLGPVCVVFHFFSDDEIECDIDPREITSQPDLDALLGFMRQLGDALRRQVILTPENRPEDPFLTYDPIGDVFRLA